MDERGLDEDEDACMNCVCCNMSKDCCCSDDLGVESMADDQSLDLEETRYR